MTTTRAPARALVLLLALLAAALGFVVAGAPASAATVDVVLTDREPAVVSLRPGDSVRFVNGESGLLALHRVTSAQRDGSAAWSYDSGNLSAGQAGPLATFPSAGTFVFLDRRGGPGPLGQDLFGRIDVVAPAPAAAPAPPLPAPAAPAPPPPAPPAPPAAAPAPASAPAAPAGSLAGLTGSAGLGGLQQPVPGGVVPPAFADLLAEAGVEPPQAEGPPPVQALQGPLPGETTLRALGLPAALAALAAVGVVSLLVRVLLAEPVARTARGFTPVRVRPAG